MLAAYRRNMFTFDFLLFVCAFNWTLISAVNLCVCVFMYIHIVYQNIKEDRKY